MKNRYIFLISVIVFIIQTTFMQIFRVDGIIPNLNLILLVLLVLKLDLKSCIVYAVSSGLIQDLFVGKYIGVNVFLYVVIVLIIINFEDVFNKVSLISPILLIMISTVSYNLLFYLLMQILGADFSYYYFFNILIIEIALNSIWVLVFYHYAKKITVKR